MKILLKTLCVLSLSILAACSPASTATPTLPASPSALPSKTNTPAATPTEEPVPEAVLMIGQTLAQQLHLGQNQVAIASLEKRTWKDSCLEIALEGATCSKKQIPGYKVIFQVGEDQYTYHMDESGDILRLVSAPVPQVGNPIIAWQFLDDYCQSALIGDKGVAFGECNAPMIATSLNSEERQADFEYFAESFFPFQAETPAGKVIFTGNGTQKPTLSEKRMIAEWARLVYIEAISGRSGASYGIALAWHREGGIAGFCDDISVYLTGEVYATSCKSGAPTGLGRSRLDAAQLTQIYTWVDNLDEFEISQSDGEGVMDSLTTYLAFSGTGSQQPDEEVKEAILKFASELYAGFSPASAGADIDQARQALILFFQFLHDGKYKEATDYFNGSYETLISMNPDIPSHDYTALLENGCKNNGLQCLLVREVIQEERLSDREFKFTVEFKNEDDSLFTLGSCCGASPTEEPAQSQFVYTVIKDGDFFLVQELPPYVP